MTFLFMWANLVLECTLEDSILTVEAPITIPEGEVILLQAIVIPFILPTTLLLIKEANSVEELEGCACVVEYIPEEDWKNLWSYFHKVKAQICLN